MATLLVIIIFFVYIGLGVPDSSFGAVLPAMWQDFNMPMSLASVVTMLISLFTLISSASSNFLISKLGTKLVIAFSTLLSALSLLGFALAPNVWFVFICAVPLGFSAGSIDTAMNNYVALHYSSAIMNFLHCFYGVGVALSPLLFSLVLGKNSENWRLGYYLIFGVQLFISLTAFLSIPIWDKVNNNVLSKDTVVNTPLSFRKMLKAPSVRAVFFAFFFTCALEFTCDTWATTYFVKAEGLTEAKSAVILTFYYLGITLGRFLAGILSIKISCEKILTFGYSLILVALITLFLPVPTAVKGVALFLIGLGNGPVFPNLTYITSHAFGKEYSQSLISGQMVASNLGILTIPPLFGLIVDFLSIQLFPVYLAVLFVLLALFTLLFAKRPKKDAFLAK